MSSAQHAISGQGLIDLSGLLDLLDRQPEFASLLADLRGGLPEHSLKLARSVRPYVTAGLARGLKRPVLVLLDRQDHATQFADQMLAWNPQKAVRLFPEPGSLFYERAPWASNAIRSRLQVLSDLRGPQAEDLLIISTARAVMQRTLPPALYEPHSFTLRAGQRLPMGSIDAFLRALLGSGYSAASVVTESGSFSRRGGILDLFPPGLAQPVRIELWGDDIDSLRAFDPASQRSLETLAMVQAGPAREALPALGPQALKALKGWTGQNPAAANGDAGGLPGIERELEALGAGESFPHLEFYLPLMGREEASLLDYLPPETLFIVEDMDAFQSMVAELEEQALELRQAALERGEIPAHMPLPYLTWDTLHDALDQQGTLELGGGLAEISELAGRFGRNARYGGQLKVFIDDMANLARAAQHRAVVVSAQAPRLVELWTERRAGSRQRPELCISSAPAPGEVIFIQGVMAEGWSFENGLGQETRLLTDAEIFGWQRQEPRRRGTQRVISPEGFFADLSPGDLVVHAEFGIARFDGLAHRTLNGTEREYLLLRFEGGDALYVPIHQADRLSRYIGVDETDPSLTRLGSTEWNRTRQRAHQAVEEVARGLLELYAQREAVTGHAFSPDTPWQAELEASFGYIETEDQLKAVAEVKMDMERPRPMDRLICGDVGFGKTEVALRAAFKAVMDGMQVAVLVPTTVLAQQHMETFRRRLAAFPVKVEMLSRFRTAQEQDIIVDHFAAGTVDILIGTHRLLGKDVVAKNLGLLIIDEEQRFGVTHKEQLKRMRTEVDVLTLTATPIPRTLYMSLAGVRDISLINTPPEDRLPVVTQVGRRDDQYVRQAILREIDRGGQVFFVHNRVQTIYAEADRLRRLLPGLRIGVAHGQMNEHELERVMEGFGAGDLDVLVSTNIIEAGLDIPNANTLIVDRADRFGLAQLYQLRGRVGRSAQRAYAYFFHPPIAQLTDDARARLEVIAEHTELGAGMSIAMRDLEIRGAGELLGTRQSGHIAAVGFHLYLKMLADAVARLQQGESIQDEGQAVRIEPRREMVTIELPVPTYVPTDYIPDLGLRIQIYRRMADLNRPEDIQALGEELADRFGPLPEPVENLLYQLRVKTEALRAGVEAVVGEGEQISIRLPGLALVDRTALQGRLGRGTRVSRTSIWLPRAADWRIDLLELLTLLADQPPQPTAMAAAG